MHTLCGKTPIQRSINGDFLTGTTSLCWHCQRPFQRVLSWWGLPLNQYSVLSVTLWSLQLWPAWNHAYSSLSFLSNAVLMCSEKTQIKTLYLPCWPACIGCQVSFYCGSDCLSFVAWLTHPCSLFSAPSPHSISSCKSPQEPPLTPHL